MTATKDFQAVVDLTAEQFNHKSMLVRIKDVNRGRACKKYIVLPKWLQSQMEMFQIYYAVHEMVHYIRGQWMCRHDSAFQSIEDRALALWGIAIQRRRAYPKSMRMDDKSMVCP